MEAAFFEGGMIPKVTNVFLSGCATLGAEHALLVPGGVGDFGSKA